MKTNPFSTLLERDAALDYILQCRNEGEARDVLEWIIDHRDHRLAESLSAALRYGEFR